MKAYQLIEMRAIILAASVFSILFFLAPQLSAQQLQARPCGPDSIPPALKIIFWQGSGGADFKPACREHDRCYTKGSGRIKSDCDTQFLLDLQYTCQSSRNPRKCLRRARFMHWLTVRFGHSAFGT